MGGAFWRLMCFTVVMLLMYVNFAKCLPAEDISFGDDDVDEDVDEGLPDKPEMDYGDLDDEIPNGPEFSHGEDTPDDYDDSENTDYDDDSESDEDYPEGMERKKRAAVKYTFYMWKDGRIPYTGLHSFNGGQQAKLRQAMKIWESVTCLKFVPKTSKDKSYMHLKRGRYCTSYTAFRPGMKAHPVTFNRRCFYKMKVLLHELGHLIGLFHTHNGPGRDKHVEILYKNIKRRNYGSFRKEGAYAGNYGIPYDYRSIMHYPYYMFRKRNGGSVTMLAKDGKFTRHMGTYGRLSFRDIKIVNIMYQCRRRGKCKRFNSDCPGEGFLNINCECQCPHLSGLGVVKCSDYNCPNNKPDDYCQRNKNRCHEHTIRYQCKETCKTCYVVKPYP